MGTGKMMGAYSWIAVGSSNYWRENLEGDLNYLLALSTLNILEGILIR